MKVLLLIVIGLLCTPAFADCEFVDNTDELTGEKDAYVMCISGEQGIVIREDRVSLVSTERYFSKHGGSDIFLYKFDDDDLVSTTPSAVTDQLVVLRSTTFIQRAATAKQVIVRVRDYSYSKVTTTFDLTGSGEAIKQLTRFNN